MMEVHNIVAIIFVAEIMAMGFDIIAGAEPPNSLRCPYDITIASRMIPKSCYQNNTDPSTIQSNCCWNVYASYIFAIAQYANRTGTVFMDLSHAKRCTNEFVHYVRSRGLVRSSFFANNSRCVMDPTAFTAHTGPCHYGSLQEIWNDVDLNAASSACYGPDLSQADACRKCQTNIEKSTFELLNLTKTKEFVPCGMATTIGVWARSPSESAFRNFFMCIMQVLENIGSLGTGSLIPSPPDAQTPHGISPVSSQTGFDSHHRSHVVVAASLAGSISLVLVFIVLVFVIKLKCCRPGQGSTQGSSLQGLTRSLNGTKGLSQRDPLPTEGLYIFTKRELKQATDGFHGTRVLGEGGSGKVYLGLLPSGKMVAVKRILKRRKLDEFYQEVELLSRVRHPNLTSLLGYCLHKREHILVYEYMPGGDLAHLVQGSSTVTWKERLKIAMECAEGLVYLHEFPDGAIVHRDIKPTNILLSESGQAKLSDFGVSKLIASNITHVSTEIKGTTGYLDPEYFSVGHLTEASDVYSFGIVLLELISGRKSVITTPSGGAESIVYSTHLLMRSENPDIRMLVDARMGVADDDLDSITHVVNIAYKCVQPYRYERPSILQVVKVLRETWANYHVVSMDKVMVAENSEDNISDQCKNESPLIRLESRIANTY
eukprot:Gb_27433 [translate_table: standard]